MNQFTSRLLASASVLGATIFSASAAFAQEAGAGQLEEIVVTAQKREQNLQDVPISITSFSGETLTKAGVVDIRGIQNIDSSLTIVTGGSTTVPFIRGVGNPNTGPGNESSVTMYIDNIYYSRVTEAFLDISNIERIEILKGPQGTLFGRNSTGGLINIITRDPSMSEMALDATLGYGNYNTVTGKFYASTPLSDNAAIDISVSAKDQQDGWGKNLFTGRDMWKAKYVNVRSKIVADLTDTTKVTLAGYYIDSRSQIGLQSTRPAKSPGLTPAIYGPPQIIDASLIDFFDVNVNSEPFVTNEVYGGSVKIEQDLNFAEFMSTTSYLHSNQLFSIIGQVTASPFIWYNLNTNDRQINQELQLKSKAGSPFD
ncbi:MAG: TonB-dependent receptor, partial [Pyrinomonadaceae bacterium]